MSNCKCSVTYCVKVFTLILFHNNTIKKNLVNKVLGPQVYKQYVYLSDWNCENKSEIIDLNGGSEAVWDEWSPAVNQPIRSKKVLTTPYYQVYLGGQALCVVLMAAQAPARVMHNTISIWWYHQSRSQQATHACTHMPSRLMHRSLSVLPYCMSAYIVCPIIVCVCLRTLTPHLTPPTLSASDKWDCECGQCDCW